MGTKITTPEGYIIESDSSEEAILVARELTAPPPMLRLAEPVLMPEGPVIEAVPARMTIEVPEHMTLEDVVHTYVPEVFEPSWRDLAFGLTKVQRETLIQLILHDTEYGQSVDGMAEYLRKANNRNGGSLFTSQAASSRMQTLLAHGLVVRLKKGTYRATEEARKAYRNIQMK
jgi:hypothetical protein